MKGRLILYALVLFAWCHAASADDQVSVQVKTSKVRSQPNLWSGSVATVSYGDALQKLSEDAGWLKVKARGASGYLPASSVTERKVVLNASGSVAGGHDASDVVLAGKGFNKGVEAQYAQTSHLNYATVDAIEKVKVSDAEVREFVQSGQLKGGK